MATVPVTQPDMYPLGHLDGSHIDNIDLFTLRADPHVGGPVAYYPRAQSSNSQEVSTSPTPQSTLARIVRVALHHTGNRASASRAYDAYGETVFVPHLPEIASEDGTLRVVQASGGICSSDTASLAEQYLAERFRFVMAEGWHTGNSHDDIDGYDGHPLTIYALASRRGDDGRQDLLAGARFTQVPSLQSSLTFSMLNGNKRMAKQALYSNPKSVEEANNAGEQRRLYDLTRWVTALDSAQVDQMTRARSMLKIMGAGLNATSSERGQAIWIFLAGYQMKRMLDRTGIATEVLAQGRVSKDDNEDSYLCIVRPEDAMAGLLKIAGDADSKETRLLATSAYRTIASSAQSLHPRLGAHPISR